MFNYQNIKRCNAQVIQVFFFRILEKFPLKHLLKIVYVLLLVVRNTFISCEKCNVFEEEFLETIQSNDYNLVMINKDCKRLIEVVSENFTIESYRSDLRETIKCCKEQLIKLERFEEIVLKMTMKVTNWNPSSEDLIAFKQFMLDQLEQTSQKGTIEYYKNQLSEAQTRLKLVDKEYKLAREKQITQLLNSLEDNISKLKQLQAQRSKDNLWLKEVYKAIKQK
jgi:hypothetical protein